jgi:hypothetical protein
MPKGGIAMHPTFIFATTWKIPAIIVAFNAKKVAYQCHSTFIFATYLNGGEFLRAARPAGHVQRQLHVGYAYTV